MKRTLTGTLVAVVAGAAMVAAQANSPRAGSGSDTQAPKAPSSQTPSSSPAGSKSSDKPGTITYTGCLETGTAPGTFVLTNASTGSHAKSAGSAASTIVEEKFLLSGAPANFNMSTSVNHKIEITGVVADMAGMSSASSSVSARPPSPATPPASPSPDKPEQQVEPRAQPEASAPMEAGLRTITVRSAKVLSDRCSTF